MVQVQRGVYQHYKGGLYTVLMTVKCATNGPHNGEDMVVYVSHTTGAVYARLVSEFCAKVGSGVNPVTNRFMFIASTVGGT